MSTGKRRRQEPIRDSSDSEEGDDSIYDLNWEPEEGSVFKVPLHEFYTSGSQIPERFKDARDWTTECLVGTLQGTKRSNKASEGLLYGIKFDDGNATAWYPRIYEWEDYCSGPDMTSTAVVTSTILETAQGSSSGSRRSESDSDSESDDSDGDQVIATCDEDDCAESEDEDPMGEEPAECDGDTSWGTPHLLTRCLPRSNGRTPVWSVLTPD